MASVGVLGPFLDCGWVLWWEVGTGKHCPLPALRWLLAPVGVLSPVCGSDLIRCPLAASGVVSRKQW